MATFVFFGKYTSKAMEGMSAERTKQAGGLLVMRSSVCLGPCGIGPFSPNLKPQDEKPPQAALERLVGRALGQATCISAPQQNPV